MGKLYLERKEAGVCARCGTRDERTAAGRVYCTKCAQDQRSGKVRKREYMISRKRCVRCGEKDWRTEKGFTECEACVKKYYNSPSRNASMERYKQRQKAQRKEWRQAGVCTKCGGTRDRDGYLLCSKCAERMQEYMKTYRET